MASLTEIAESILASAKSLDAYTSSKGLPSPSFDRDTLSNLPEDVEWKRKALIDETQTLKRLALGPTGLYHEILGEFTDLISLRAIYCYNLAAPVPVNGEASYAEIARASRLDEGHVCRFLKHAMTNRLFQETEAGLVKHTVASRMLKEDPALFDFVGLLSDDFHAASTKVIESMRKYPGSEEPTETGFNVEYNTSSPLYVELAKDPERMRRFRSGMSFSLRDEGLDLRHLVKGFDWAELDSADHTVVDVGGGHGDVAHALASATSNLKFVVQDLPGTVKEAKALLPNHLRDRVSFMEHDFFSPQPVEGASIYFFRWILHDWSDKYCVKILQSLVPGMKNGSKVLLYEYLLPEIAHLPWSFKMVRNLDMMMKVCWNARVRGPSDWQDLFKRAHPGYQLLGVRRPEGSSMFLIEAVFKSEPSPERYLGQPAEPAESATEVTSHVPSGTVAGPSTNGITEVSNGHAVEPSSFPSAEPAPVAPEPIAVPSAGPAPVSPEPVAVSSAEPVPVAPEPVDVPSGDPMPISPEPTHVSAEPIVGPTAAETAEPVKASSAESPKKTSPQPSTNTPHGATSLPSAEKTATSAESHEETSPQPSANTSHEAASLPSAEVTANMSEKPSEEFYGRSLGVSAVLPTGLATSVTQ